MSGSLKKSKGTSSKKNIVTLSLNKLQKLLHENSYTLVSLYCEGDATRFLEVRTPKIQKTFIIALPRKYKLLCSESSYKRIEIYPSDERDSRQIDYLTELKGPLIDCDLVSISSFMVCLYKNNGDFETFKFGKKQSLEIEEESEDSEIVEKLMKSVKAISKKIDLESDNEKKEEADIEGEAKEGDAEEGEEGDIEEGGDEKDDEIVEIVFEDENGKEFDGTASGILEENVIVPETSLEPTKEKKIVPRVLKNKTNNNVPENLENLDLSLGLIYFSIDIDKFYKNANRKIDMEEDIISVYDIIDENENDIRNEKADDIMELCAKLTIKVKEETEKYKKDEDHFKNQILKLTLVLQNTELLKTKVDKADKFLDSKVEINRLYNQTKTTLHDINIEILRNKDRIDDFLAQYHSALEDMLN